MKSSVVIKGCKSGMTVILNPDTPFEQLLEDVGKKFKESEKFWGSAQMTLTLEGRELTNRGTAGDGCDYRQFPDRDSLSAGY